MATSNRLISVGAMLLFCWFAAGCSSSGSKPSNGTLQFTSPTSAPTLELSTSPQSVTLTTNQTVNWSLQSGTGCFKAQGTLSSAQGASTTYTAPVTSAATCFTGPLLVSVVATSTADASVSAIMVIEIVQSSPTITPATLGFFSSCPPPGTLIPPADATSAKSAVAQVGTFYTLTLGDQGYSNVPSSPAGVPPFTWAMTSGSLPAGLSMSPGTDSSNIVISGTPTAAGCSASTTFTLQITDATGVASPPATYSLVVIPSSLKVQSPTLPSAYNVSGDPNGAGVPYSPVTFIASNGVPPYTWAPYTQGNTVPLPGLNLSEPTAGSNILVVSGTPAAGSSGSLGTAYTDQFQVSDSQQPYPAMFITSTVTTNNLVLPQFCSPANDGTILPNTSNGGTVGGNAVLADAYLQGSFAFLLRGFDASGGPIAVAGSATMDGAGNVTGGEEDISTSSGHQTLAIQPGSTYVLGITSPTVGSNISNYARGCMALALKDSGNNVTTTNFAFTLGGCSNHFTESTVNSTADNACGMTQSSGQNVPAGEFTLGRIMELDCAPGTTCAGPGTARASGILRQQDSSSFASALSGPYAFGLSGQDSAAGRYAMAGSFQASSASLTAVAADIDDAGTIASQLTGGSGTFSAGDSSGRVTASLTAGTASFNLAGYVVGTNEVLFVTTDTLGAGHPILGGEAVSSATSFTSASLQNSHIFHIGGVTAGNADVSIGTITFDGIGTFSGTESEDQAGTLGSATLSGAYAVDPATGRALFVASQQGQSLGAHPFVAYVVPMPTSRSRGDCSINQASCITGFLVGTDNSAQDGILEFQTPTFAPPPPFNSLFVAGDYTFGTDEPLVTGNPAVEGSAYAGVSANSTTTGTLGINGISGSHPILQDAAFADANYCLQPGCYLILPSETLSGSYSVNPNGTGTFGNGKASVTNGNVIFYIDESSMSLNGAATIIDPHPSIVVAEQ